MQPRMMRQTLPGMIAYERAFLGKHWRCWNSVNGNRGDKQMTKLSIVTEYSYQTDTVFDMPEGKTWDDVKDWYVKWGTLFVTFNDNSTLEVETKSHGDWTDVDLKRPIYSAMYPCDVEGNTDWGEETLAELG
jgi:hypothetical protein